ncbi:MAG: drug/metabolite transporter (DMT)-like permease [Gammaproteobacteria bacterium]|jgi:drug/metabolite transporter (DMT)-like permease
MRNHSLMINWGLLACLILLWGTSFMFVSISLVSVDPLSIVFFRVFLGAIVVTIIVYSRGRTLPLSVKSWAAFLLMGLVGNIMPFYLISWGQQSIDSGVAGMIMATMPLSTMVLAHFLIEGENLNRFKLLGFVMGITGVAILLGPVFQGSGRAVISGIAIFVAATSYACNSILVRRLPKFDPLIATSGVLIAATLFLLPIWLWNSPLQTPSISPASMMSVIWLGIGPTGIATVLLFVVIERAGPTFLSTINYLIPVVAFFAGAYLLAEPVSWHSIVALVTILGGIGITRFRATHNPAHR